MQLRLLSKRNTYGLLRRHRREVKTENGVAAEKEETDFEED